MQKQESPEAAKLRITEKLMTDASKALTDKLNSLPGKGFANPPQINNAIMKDLKTKAQDLQQVSEHYKSLPWADPENAKNYWILAIYKVAEFIVNSDSIWRFEELTKPYREAFDKSHKIKYEDGANNDDYYKAKASFELQRGRAQEAWRAFLLEK